MIVREKKTAFNGAHCEAGVDMSQAKADKYLFANAHIYSGYATLDAHPGLVYFVRAGASLFPKSPGCTAHLLPEVDAGQPTLISSHTEYVRPGQKTFLPKFQLFRTDSRGKPTTKASECVEGGLGSCWLIGAIASVAQHPGAITRLFKKNRDGTYDVTLHVSKTRRAKTFTVDDALPACRKGTGFAPAYARPAAGAPPAIWPCLLEKVFAIAHGGSYLKLNGGEATGALEMLTGSPCKMLPLDRFTPETLFDEIEKLLRDHAIVAWSGMFDRRTFADLEFKGPIAQMHVYSILGSRKGKKGALELQIRNPWGRKGLLQAGAAVTDQADGTFWMNARDIVRHKEGDIVGHFDGIAVAQVKN